MNITSLKVIRMTVTALVVTFSFMMTFSVLAPSVFAQDPRQLTLEKSKATDKRIALVIGNGAYTKAKTLPNPANDAADMAKVLKELGFEVLSGVDLNKRQMQDLIRDFGAKLASGSVGLFYYAGHSVQVGGSNYLVPIDADIPKEDEVEFEAVPLGLILTKMSSAKNDLNIVILDACRNNPFARSWSSYRDTGNSDGLAKISPPTGTLVLYATEPGNVASDGTGRNGLFTEALLKQIIRPNVEYDQMVKAVSTDVWQRSNRQQLPWKEGNSLQDFYFVKNVQSLVGKTGPTITAKDKATKEKEAWDLVKDSNDIKDFVAFAFEFPEGEYVKVATLRIDNLAWAIAKSSNDKAKVKAYLDEFEDGENAAVARILLRQLETNEIPSNGNTKSMNEKVNFKGKYGTFDFMFGAKTEGGTLSVSNNEISVVFDNTIKFAPERLDCRAFADATVEGGYIDHIRLASGRTLLRKRFYPNPPASAGDVLTKIRQACTANTTAALDTNRKNVNPKSDSIEVGTQISNKLGMKFAYIPAGSFQMGGTQNDSEKPIHAVTISQGFYMGTTEVTQAQWASVMWNNPSSFNSCDNCPVENVSWEDVQAFIKKLNARGDGKYRLPTEAEWEYAARAGSTTKYSFGDNESFLGIYAWYDRTSESRTHDVATRKPNAWGLYDMHGNVWEWVQDWYGDYPNGNMTDPTGASSGSERVIRGGSWGVGSASLRSASRNAYSPSIRDQFLGFRVVRY